MYNNYRIRPVTYNIIKNENGVETAEYLLYNLKKRVVEEKMIDIENAYNEFDKYTSQYNPNDGRIKLKIEHIKRVAEKSKKIARNPDASERGRRSAGQDHWPAS